MSDGSGGLFLSWTAPRGGSRSYWLRAGRNRVGSSAGNELVLDAPGVSRHHAELWLENGRVRLRDLGSKNGTWVNGEPVAGAGLLPLALVAVPGPAPAAANRHDLLELVLRLFSRFWDREQVPRASASGESDLVFPADYVPGTSEASRRLHTQLRSALQGDLPILLTGPTGAGKDAIARVLHRSSAARDRPFVAVNCAAIPPDLLESELFGIEAGVATGVSRRAGRFQQAGGGFLLLDEIGDMPLGLQAKLLRVLESKEVTPVGGSPTAVEARIVAATNADLDRRIRDGQFRSDLYYRLAGFVVEVPPLAERREDVPALVESVVRRCASRLGKEVPGVSIRALRRLGAYGWPGNVRELRHVIDRLVCSCSPGEPIHAGLLPGRFSAEAAGEETDLSLPAQVAALEKRLVRDALERTAGNQSEAARLLGVSRNGLRHRMARLGLADEGGR